MTLKVVVTGSREWISLEIIAQAFQYVLDTYHVTPAELTVVEGEARGADLECRVVAEALGMTVIPVPADWKHFGRAAGPIRNQQMLDEHPDIQLALAFHDDLKNSKGTADMVQRVLKKRLPVLHWTTNGIQPSRLTD